MLYPSLGDRKEPNEWIIQAMDDDLDRVHRGTSTRVREVASASENTDIQTSASSQGAWKHTRPLALAAATLVMSVVAIAFGLPRAPSPSAPRPAGVVRVGDIVAGSGVIVQTERVLELCRVGGRVTSFGPSCSSIAVVVDGVDPLSIPGWTPRVGGGYAEEVAVVGVLTSLRSIRVQAVSQAPWPEETASPCRTADAGQVSPTVEGHEAALRALNREVGDHPDQYGGAWPATLPDGTEVMVVGVVGPLDEAVRVLSSVFPYQLCAVSVERSLRELGALDARLAQEHPEWFPTTDIPSNQVQIVVALMDDTLSSQLEPYGSSVAVDPLVRLATPGTR